MRLTTAALLLFVTVAYVNCWTIGNTTSCTDTETGQTWVVIG